MRIHIRYAGILVAVALLVSGCGSEDSATRPRSNDATVEWSSADADLIAVGDVAVNEELVAVAGEGPDKSSLSVFERGSKSPRWTIAADGDLGPEARTLQTEDADAVTLAESADSPVVAKAQSAKGGRDVLVGLASADGAVVWTWAPQSRAAEFVDVLGATKDQLVVRIDDGKAGAVLAGVALADGREVWQQRLADVDFQNQAVLRDGHILLADRVLEAATGETLWETDKEGRVLGISGTTILWVAATESPATVTPELIDIADPTSKQPVLARGEYVWSDAQSDLVSVATWDGDRPTELSTYLAGEDEVTTFPVDDVDVFAGVWADERLYVVDGTDLQAWSRTGKLLDEVTLPGDHGYVVKAVHAGTALLASGSKWLVVELPA